MHYIDDLYHIMHHENYAATGDVVKFSYNIYFDFYLTPSPLSSGDGTLRKNPVIWKNWKPSMGPALHKLAFTCTCTPHGHYTCGEILLDKIFAKPSYFYSAETLP